MILRLMYYLITTRQTRAMDKREYNEQLETLDHLYNKMWKKRKKISCHLYNAWEGEVKCIHYTDVGEYFCNEFDDDCDCSCYNKKVAFIQAENAYYNQKQLVKKFWRTRMRERVKGWG